MDTFVVIGNPPSGGRMLSTAPIPDAIDAQAVARVMIERGWTDVSGVRVDDSLVTSLLLNKPGY